MNVEEDNSDEFDNPRAGLYGYALARIMNEEDAAKVVTAVTSSTQFTDHEDEQLLMHALKTEIRLHFADKYKCREYRTKSVAEVGKLMATPFITSVKLSAVHTEMLESVSPSSFWEASRECLSMLHPIQADVYVLREMEDVSCEEISEITGLSFEVVLELVYRGRMKFVECLLMQIGNDL